MHTLYYVKHFIGLPTCFDVLHNKECAFVGYTELLLCVIMSAANIYTLLSSDVVRQWTVLTLRRKQLGRDKQILGQQ
jgi:hypothetical protein